jgi:hypothetical protein
LQLEEEGKFRFVEFTPDSANVAHLTMTAAAAPPTLRRGLDEKKSLS